MSFWPTDTAGDIADVCSVIGLIVTGVLTTGAWQVRRRFERFLVYPAHVAKLEDHCLKVTIFLNNFATADKTEVTQEMGALQGNLNSLRPFLAGAERKTLDQVAQLLEAYHQIPDEAHLRRLYGTMYQLLTEMQNLSDVTKY